MTVLDTEAPKLRLLVVIASYGERNLELLKQVIRQYQAMTLDVDVMVVSNAPKELGPDVRVVVGLPSANPWSLPFAHKPIFAENVDQYDLFIYSEDDMAVTEDHIASFLRVTPHLAPDEIAGFLRYEVDRSGAWSLPDVHGDYHWRPETVAKRGDLTVAEFSNEHAAFYLLNRAQLRTAIASGGFLREPYEGRYDMLCAAATDPYTSCGLRKVICISEVQNFLVHHMSNRYAGDTGIPLAAFKKQIETLMAIAEKAHPASSLANVESWFMRGRWSKDFYELPDDGLLRHIPHNVKTVLSIGSGWGATEAALQERGAVVTALPLDSVVGAEAARRGIEIVYGTLSDGLDKLSGRTFDCVVISELLHLLPDPEELLDRCARLVPTGAIFISGHNFGSLRIRVSRAIKRQEFAKLGSFKQSGIHIIGPAEIKKSLKKSGLTRFDVHWVEPSTKKQPAGLLGPVVAERWVLKAER
jgi:2-polyprenyl-3-methyl-5-hydroxy-6-metoxy-1,4-benzoquinol methylase